LSISTNTKHTNRLINEKSPYLLQHAHNPVDWYPWNEKAFAKVKSEDKPIFLSIGYSTCHWCHNMARESFEDPEIAEILNEKYVSIKVDREERPDIDNIYMSFCQLLTGHGGWPLTIIMTPDSKPFFAGTYFPKYSRNGHPGLIDILNKVANMWETKRDIIIDSSENFTEVLEDSSFPQGRKGLGLDILTEAFNEFSGFYDQEYGGFSDAPKFPSPSNLLFLLRYYYTSKNEHALKMVEKTLKSMYKGGIFDHIGFGFSRYSTDRKWLVPHFEKMLYDNALLALVYLEAYQITKKELYKEIAEKVFTYILRDMVSPEGGFYSAEDADSEGEEGRFYVWDFDEINSILDDADTFCKYYGISPSGSFEGRNIPNLIDIDIDGLENNMPLKGRLESMREILFNHRKNRIHPHKDDKILTSWNGLMIVTLAYGARILNNKKYLVTAELALDFIFNKLIRADGRLLARYRDGESAFPAYLEDYAFLIWGLIELYEATHKPTYLEKAINLTHGMIKYFWDEKNGGFFIYGNDSEQLILRPKLSYDGALPSGGAVASLNMLRLARITGYIEFEEKAHLQMDVFSPKILDNPASHTTFLIALMYYNLSVKEIVITGDINENKTREMLKEINKRYLPFSTFVLNNESRELNEIIPSLQYKNKVGNQVTAYVCQDYTCKEPITNIDKLAKLLDS